MPVKQFKPTSPGRRGASGSTFEEITKKKPEKSLLAPLRKKGGRNNQGRVTVRHRGGGHKRRYRIIDWKRRDRVGQEGKVTAIEYDPNRTARIALVAYADGEKRYILAPQSLSVGDRIAAGPEAPLHVGNALPLQKIPNGTMVHCVELIEGRGAQMVRSGRRRRPDHGQRARLLPSPPAIRRNAPGAGTLFRYYWPSWQPGAWHDQARQGGSLAASRPTPYRARGRHEPGGPSARRWGGQGARWPSRPQDTVGQTGARLPYAWQKALG